MPRPISTKPFRPRTSHLSYDIQAKKKAIHRIQEQTKEERTKFVIDTLTTFFQDGIKANPAAFRGRFRKMAATPFNFYRGSAVLFYQDLKSDQDPFIAQNPAAGHVFIHVSLWPLFLFHQQRETLRLPTGRFACRELRDLSER